MHAMALRRDIGKVGKPLKALSGHAMAFIANGLTFPDTPECEIDWLIRRGVDAKKTGMPSDEAFSDESASGCAFQWASNDNPGCVS